MVSAMDMGSEVITSEDVAEIELLSRFCLPPEEKRLRSRALRPERPEYANYMGELPSREWLRALMILQKSIHATGQSVESVCARLSGLLDSEDEAMAYQAVAAVLYDQECSGISIPRIDKLTDNKSFTTLRKFMALPTMLSFAKHMLFVDYGLGELPLGGSLCFTSRFIRKCWPLIRDLSKSLAEFSYCCRNKHHPDRKDWIVLGDLIYEVRWPGADAADAAIMLYNYHTHHKDLTILELESGLTGYTGVMRELRAELPRRGPARLLRKLSIDVNYTIPGVVLDTQRMKILIRHANAIATEISLCLTMSIAPGHSWHQVQRQKPVQGEESPPSYSKNMCMPYPR
jgi:hypothetical protein